jgi:hypothetical protein
LALKGFNIARLCAKAMSMMKTKIKTRYFVIAMVAAFTAVQSIHPQKATRTDMAETRLAQLVEANIIAVHAFQVLLAKSSGKGQACFSTGNLSDQAVNALSEHQAKLLKTDSKQLRLWLQGRESTFNPSEDLQPILNSGLKIPDKAPVNVFTKYLRQNT